VFAAIQLIIVAGMAGFVLRLILHLRARHRSKQAGRKMGRLLRTSVRSENVHQTIATLRNRRDVEVQPLESAMASRADLCQRIEGIRLSIAARTAASGPRLSCGVASPGSLIGRLSANMAHRGA
jgi:hypothetical protein